MEKALAFAGGERDVIVIGGREGADFDKGGEWE